MVARKAKKKGAIEVVDKVDTELVDKAVADIRGMLVETLNKGMISVGDYVLRTFFRNDPERVRSKDPGKEASFRELAERCGTPDLPISKSWLNAAVGICVLRRALPQGTSFKALPPSHQVALLPLREQPETLEKVATRVLARKLSVKNLREVVTEEVARAREKDGKDGPARGRPRKPLVVKTLDRTSAIFAFDGGRKSFTKAMVDELDDGQTKAALKTARSLLGSLQGLIEKLEARGG